MWAQSKSRFFAMLDAEGRSLRTLVHYREAIDQFLGHFLATDPRKLPGDVTAADIDAFTVSLRRRKLSDNTVASRWRSLRRFFRWLYKEDIIGADVIRTAARPRERTEAVRPFSEEEVGEVMGATQAWPALALRDQTILALLYNTGMRAGELCSLRPSAMREGAVVVRGKGKKERWLALEPVTGQLLGAFVATRESQRSIFGLSVNGLYRIIARLAWKTGVAAAYPHRFRDTFAVRFLENGGGIDQLQILLGHADIETTLRYIQYGKEHRAMDAQRRFAPFAVSMPMVTEEQALEEVRRRAS